MTQPGDSYPCRVTRAEPLDEIFNGPKMAKQKNNQGRLSRLFGFSARELCFILLGGLGLFFGLPNPIMQLPLLALLFPFAISILALEADGEARAIASAFSTILLGGGLAVHWLVYPMINFGKVPLPLAVVFMLLLVAVLSVYYIIYALLLRFYRDNLPRPLLLLAGAITWGALEYARGWIFTGVTWCSLSSAMLGWPAFAQAASLLGMFGLSALYALAALCFVPLARRKAGHTGRCSEGYHGRRRSGRGIAQAVYGLLIISGLFAYGQIRLQKDFVDGKAVILAQAQGNIDQAQKWQPARQMATVQHYIRLSQYAIDASLETYGQRPDLMVWPETAMPFYFQNATELGRPIRYFARIEQLPVLFGVPARSAKLSSDDSYNRVWLLNKQGADAGYYDKEHLVPFGEYIPRGLYVPFASEFLQGHGFTPGNAKEPLAYKQFKFGVLICYEAIFPELAQARVKAGANLLVNVSNDAWFADSPAPWQHLQLSAMRCIEQGRYMLRSTNTGLSALIDPAGRVHGMGPLFKNYSSAHRAYLLEETTFFNYHYELINTLLAYLPFVFIALGLVNGLRKRIMDL